MSLTIPKPSTLNAKPRIQSPSDINLQIPNIVLQILQSRVPEPRDTEVSDPVTVQNSTASAKRRKGVPASGGWGNGMAGQAK